MPDRDVFTYHVPKGWRPSARLLLRSEVVPEFTIDRVCTRAVAELRKSGSSAISEMVVLLESYRIQEAAELDTRDVSIITQLRRIAMDDDSQWAGLAARRFGSVATFARYGLANEPVDLKSTVVEIFVDYVEQRILTNDLIAALVAEEDYSHAYLNRRIDEIRSMLVNSDVFRSVASQLVDGVEPQSITLPHRKVPKRTTAELVSAPL